MNNVVLKNLTGVMQAVEAADGDHVYIMPHAQVTTEEKFLWRLNERAVRRITRRAAKVGTTPSPAAPSLDGDAFSKSD